MLRDYLLWYKETEGGKEIIACITRDYYSAEKLGEQLLFFLTHFANVKTVYEIGITRVEINKIHFDLDTLESRWVIYRNGEWFLDEDSE